MKKMSSLIVMMILGLGILTIVSPAAEEQAPATDPAMEQWARLSSPGEQHKVLEPLVGKWNYSMRWWKAPDAPPEESTGTSENAWIMGGRFVEQKVMGQAMGQPFEGTGTIGYDNVRGEYTTIWFSNMNTGIMNVSGQYDPATKTLTDKGTFSCPITGEKNMPYHSEWKIVDNDHNTYVSYSVGPDRKEFKSMEISYTRTQ